MSSVLDVLIRIQLFLILCSNVGFDLIRKYFSFSCLESAGLQHFFVIILTNFFIPHSFQTFSPLHFLNSPCSNPVKIVVSSRRMCFLFASCTTDTICSAITSSLVSRFWPVDRKPDTDLGMSRSEGVEGLYFWTRHHLTVSEWSHSNWNKKNLNEAKVHLVSNGKKP